MATRHPMDVDTCEMESQTDTGNLKPQPLKKKKIAKTSYFENLHV